MAYILALPAADLVRPTRVEAGCVIVIAVEANEAVTGVRNWHRIERPRTQFGIKTERICLANRISLHIRIRIIDPARISLYAA